MMMEALRSSETSALTRATRDNISGDGILFLIVFVQDDTITKYISLRTNSFLFGRARLEFLHGLGL
jgi:hypothetical protein